MKLFRMTMNRILLLERVATNLNLRIEDLSPGGYAYQMALQTNQTESEIQAKRNQFEEALLVLNIVLLHTNPVFFQFHAANEKGWETEKDIPVGYFCEKIDFIIDHHEKMLERANKENNIDKLKKQLTQLRKLKQHRMDMEQANTQIV